MMKLLRTNTLAFAIAIAIAVSASFVSCDLKDAIGADENNENEETLSDAKDKLALSFAVGDSADSVTRTIDYMKTRESMGNMRVGVAFSTDAPDVISKDLLVTPSTEKDTTVVITASLNYEGVTDSKSFTVKVPWTAKAPTPSDLTGTWRRTTVEKGTDDDEAETPYVDTVATTLTINADTSYVWKESVARDYPAPRSDETLFREWKGSVSKSVDDNGLEGIETNAVPFLFFLMDASRSSPVAFTDDSGWVSMSAVHLEKTIVMYRGGLYMGTGTRIYVPATQGPYTLIGNWDFYDYALTMRMEFKSDGTYTMSVNPSSDGYQEIDTGTYTANGDGTVTVHLTSRTLKGGTSEAYENTETRKYMIFCQSKGTFVTAHLYFDDVDLENGVFRKVN